MVVENALVLATARRMIRSAGSPPLFPASAPQDRTPGPNTVGPLRSSLHQIIVLGAARACSADHKKSPRHRTSRG
jgi:hypothetical protein